MNLVTAQFEHMGDLFIEDVGPNIFSFLKLPQMPSTYATSRAMRELTKQRTRELLAVARTLNAPPLSLNLKDPDFLGWKGWVDLSDKKIGDVGMKLFSAALASGALGSLVELELGGNRIGYEGMKALALAVGSGALPSLTRLILGGNEIGDEGMQAFAAAVGSGALASCRRLDLDNNQISDPGMVPFSDAIARGALVSLEELVVDDGPLGVDHPQLRAACHGRDITLR
jgi:hypothetical protein